MYGLKGRFLGLGVAIIATVLTGCMQPSIRSWQSSLLDESELSEMGYSLGISNPCLPPCWQGLVPQESTIVDVEKNLSQVEIIDVDSIEYFMSDDGQTTVVTWQSSLVENPYYGGTLTLSEDKLIFIEIDLEYQLTLGDIIVDLGEPVLYEIVPYGAESSDKVLRFMWPENGFVAELPPLPSRYPIEQDIAVERIAYFVPGIDAVNYLVGRGSSAEYADNYKEWPGFESFFIP